MKKLCLLLVALVMLLTASALADAKVEKTTELTGTITLCGYSNHYIARVEDGYALFDSQGNMLSAVYKSMTAVDDGKYLKVQNVSSSSNINCVGLLDSQGRMLLPMEYGSIITYHAKEWVFAHVLERTNGDVGEYSDNKGNKYIIGRTDILYDGHMTHLDREEYNNSYRVTDRGPALYIKITDNEGYWLFYRNDAFCFRRVKQDSRVDTSEFIGGGKKSVIHNPTEWEAFTPSCTLTPDDVVQHVWYDSYNKRLLDLQGNVLAENLTYDHVQYRTNYVEIETNSYKYSGVMTFDGKVIIPPKYTNIARDIVTNRYFASGYNGAVDEDGNLYFYDAAGNITASAEYQLNYNDYKGLSNNAPIVHVKNMGKYLIITATHGTLPETYEEALTCGETQKVIRVKKDGNWGVIDMAGNVVVPFEYSYTPSVSYDGSLILCQEGMSKYVLYHITYTEDGSASASWTETRTSGEETGSEPVLNEGAWECVCGTITNGKFCPECGTKKPEPTPTPAPAEDGTWTCSCGSVNNGKFCPECGTKKPAEPQCGNCGYKPEGAAPKFCPECGTKF